MHTDLTARITYEDEGLIARLSDGRSLVERDPRKMALKLLDAGVHVDNAHCADWREGDIAPAKGHAIALKHQMIRPDFPFEDYEEN
jgi:hypothetical protein